MIEVFGHTNEPGEIAAGRYVLMKGDGPLREFVTPCIALGTRGSIPVVKLKRLIADEQNELSDTLRYSGAVADPELNTPSRRIGAVCDTIAEVNALIEISRTGELIFKNTQEAISNLHLELHGQSFADDNAEEIEEIRAFTLLNNSGDSTITWEKNNDEVMRALIEKKMAEGMAFFIIQPKALGFIPRPKSRISDVEEIMKRRSVAVKDEDFAEIIAAGMAGVTERPEIDTERAEQSYDAAQIARSQSVGVMPMRGG
jgi:hypothetical protein